MKTSTEIDSKFRFVILAAKRAKQLLRGSKPRLRSKSRNPIRVAQLEVAKGLVHFDIVEPIKEEVRKPKEEGFIGEEIKDRGEEPIKEDKDRAEKKVAKSKEKPKEKSKEKPKEKAKEKPKEKTKGESKKQKKGDKT